DTFRRLVDRLQIPVSPTLGSMDLLEDAHPCNVGRFGPIGQRRANFVIQNADLLLAVGSSMSLSTVGFNTSGFAPNAKKIMVNVDANEIAKALPNPDIGITADAAEFMNAMLALPAPDWGGRLESWWEACRDWSERYPCVTEDYLRDTEHVNSYVFA